MKRAAILAIVLLVAIIAVIGVVSNSLIASSESLESGSNSDAASIQKPARGCVLVIKDLDAALRQLEEWGITLQDLEEWGLTWEKIEDSCLTMEELGDWGVMLQKIEQKFQDLGIPLPRLEDLGITWGSALSIPKIARPQVLLIEDLDAALRQLEEWGISLQDLEEWGITWQEIEDSRLTMEELGNWSAILRKFNERGVTLGQLESLGTLCADPSVPPAVNLPAGIMVANIPVYKLYDLASKDYVVRLSTAEGSFELHNDSAPERTDVIQLWALN